MFLLIVSHLHVILNLHMQVHDFVCTALRLCDRDLLLFFLLWSQHFPSRLSEDVSFVLDWGFFPSGVSDMLSHSFSFDLTERLVLLRSLGVYIKQKWKLSRLQWLMNWEQQWSDHVKIYLVLLTKKFFSGFPLYICLGTAASLKMSNPLWFCSL